MARHAPSEQLRRWDEEESYPYELYARWAELGLLTLPFPTEVGGAGAGVVDLVLLAEELGRSGYDLTGLYGTPIFTGLNVLHHGTPEQQQRFLPPLLEGRIRMSVAMTEAGAGSDAGAMRTRAERRGDVFVLNGEKVFASGGAVDDTFICVYARTGDGPHQEALSAFLVDNRSPGLEIHKIPTLGRHMFPTTQLVFTDVEVPADALLGPLNGGWDVLLSGLRLERIVTSAAYVGNASAVVDEALAYAKERQQFGRRIGDFQAIAHLLADMATDVEAARWLTYRAAWLLDTGQDALLEICMAKLFGSERFVEIARQGVQILGGYGYSMEFPMQRHLRAAVGSTITAGTSQMQRETIARRLGLKPR
ncbi:MAG: acyl-CoA dehydrogenase family protein [Actinobacteria bacterium]|nr:acyl-CoA dehydrogenase family protein [Actinomycetota bacterium]